MACFHFGCRKSPRASARSVRAIRSSPGFLGDPHASFSFRRRGCLSSPSSASLGRWVLARLQEGPPSLLHGARGRSGVPLAFYVTLVHPFHSEGGVCSPRPLECGPRSLGPDKVCRESPQSSARSERAVRSSPGFLCDPRASFSLGRRGGICQATLGGCER